MQGEGPAVVKGGCMVPGDAIRWSGDECDRLLGRADEAVRCDAVEDPRVSF